MASSYPEPLVSQQHVKAPSIPTRSYVPLLLVALLVYLLLLPSQMLFDAGGLILPPYRLFLIPSVLFVIAQLLRGHLRLGLPDICILAATFWIPIAVTVTMGAERAVSGGGAQFIDIALSYLFARAAIHSLRDLRIVMILVMPGLTIIGAIIVAESVLGIYILQPLALAIFGGIGASLENVRLGLLRAPGPFPHPILAGLFLASFLPIYILSGIRGAPRVLGCIAALCSFFTVSSAAFLALGVGISLVIYNALVERIKRLTWRLFFIVSTIGLLVLQFATESGVVNLLIRFSALNAWSGYYRILIWRYGSESVANNPIFGIGYAEYERPFWMTTSVDNFWLLLGIQYGLLPPLAILLATVLAVVGLARKSRRATDVDRHLLRGIAISLAVFALGVYSVSVWLSAQVWYFMLLGIAVSLSHTNSSYAKRRDTRVD